MTKARFGKDQFLGFSGSSSPYQSTSWKPFVLTDLSTAVSTGSGPASSVPSGWIVSTFSTATFVRVGTAVAPEIMLALSASVWVVGTRVIGADVDGEVAK